MKNIIISLSGIFFLIVVSGAKGQTPEDAVKAIYLKEYDKAAEIIIGGIDVNKEVRGSYLLNVACYRGHAGLVKLLIEKGADVNAASRDGSTPLIYAARGDTNGVIVNLLLERGADIHAKVESGANAFRRAAENICIKGCEGRYKVLKILAEHGSDIENPLNIHGFDNYTVLMMAAGLKKPQLVEFLIKHGADINNVTGDGRTPLMAACEAGCIKSVKMLVKNDAKTGLKDNKGRTALQISEEEGHTEIVNFLKRH